MAEERFKTTLMGGFDKDDVLNQVREMKDAAYAEKSKLIKEKKEQEKQIQELKKQQHCRNKKKHIKKKSLIWKNEFRKNRNRKKNWSVRSAKNIKNILTAMI